LSTSEALVDNFGPRGRDKDGILRQKRGDHDGKLGVGKKRRNQK